MVSQLITPECFNYFKCENCKQKCDYYEASKENVTKISFMDKGVAIHSVEIKGSLEKLMEERNEKLYETLNRGVDFLEVDCNDNFLKEYELEEEEEYEEEPQEEYEFEKEEEYEKEPREEYEFEEEEEYEEEPQEEYEFEEEIDIV